MTVAIENQTNTHITETDAPPKSFSGLGPVLAPPGRRNVNDCPLFGAPNLPREFPSMDWRHHGDDRFVINRSRFCRTQKVKLQS